ncbi:hypothetical protein QMK28_32895, partial [Streptomyces sp. H27-D2]|nr:hypothetical protein [Streptomyces sp. H27-D2]
MTRTAHTPRNRTGFAGRAARRVPPAASAACAAVLLTLPGTGTAVAVPQAVLPARMSDTGGGSQLITARA